MRTKSSYRFSVPGYSVVLAFGGFDCKQSTARIYSSLCGIVRSCLFSILVLSAYSTIELLTIPGVSPHSRACSHGKCRSFWQGMLRTSQESPLPTCRPRREDKGSHQISYKDMTSAPIQCDSLETYRLRLNGVFTGPASTPTNNEESRRVQRVAIILSNDFNRYT